MEQGGRGAWEGGRGGSSVPSLEVATHLSFDRRQTALHPFGDAGIDRGGCGTNRRPLGTAKLNVKPVTDSHSMGTPTPCC